MSFEGKVALVTGASTGVGCGIAWALLEAGAEVVITSRHESEISEAAKRMDPSGKRVHGLVADVSNPEAMKALIEAIGKQYGRLDYVVCNAGTTGPHQVNLADYDLDAWQQVIQTNVSGTFYTMKYAIPLLKRTATADNPACIVTLSAVNGVVGIGGIAPYTASKHAVIGLTQSAALEYAGDHIRVNSVAPGYVATENIRQLPAETQLWMAEQHPMQRMATPADVANVVLFLLSPKSSFVTGSVYPVDGGYLAQ